MIASHVGLAHIKEYVCVFVAGISVVLVAAKEDTFRDADTEVDLLHSLHPDRNAALSCHTWAPSAASAWCHKTSQNSTKDVGNLLFAQNKDCVQVHQHSS